MKAVEDDSVANGRSERQAKQHRQYVEYIWDIVDPVEQCSLFMLSLTQSVLDTTTVDYL